METLSRLPKRNSGTSRSAGPNYSLKRTAAYRRLCYHAIARQRPLSSSVMFHGVLMRILGVAFLLLPMIASAGWVNRSGELQPDTDSSKAVGDFGAQLILVADEQELLRRWGTPSETVEVKTTGKVEVGGFINAFVVFGGCKPDEKSNCRVAMRFRVLQPDGKVYSETPAMEVWRDKPEPPKKTLELSVDYLKVQIEPHDQLGPYVVQAQVRDENSGAVLQLKSSFAAASK